MTKLSTIEGIGNVYQTKLKKAGVASLESLLKLGASSTGRKNVAEQSGISKDLILEWVNRADLFRVKGIGEEYSDLLEASGVDTVVELARRNGKNLHEKMTEINTAKKKVRKLPTQTQVEGWIEQAKDLPRVVTH